VIQTYLNSFLIWILRFQYTNDVRFVFNLNYLSYLLTLFVFVYNFDYVCIMAGFAFRSSLYSNVPFKPTHSLVVSPHIYMQVYILYLQVTCVCFVDRVLSWFWISLWCRQIFFSRSYVVDFLMFNELRWEVIGRFADHHCFTFFTYF
jgi:hypothetical protein